MASGYLKRGDRLWSIAVVLVLGFGFSKALASQPFAILQGPSSESVAQFALTAPLSENVQVRIVDSRGHEYPTYGEVRHRHPGFSDEVIQVMVEGLNQHEIYQLQVQGLRQSDVRLFRTTPKVKARPWIITTSCMSDSIHNSGLWDQVERYSADLMVFLGDAVYVDRPFLLSSRIPENKSDVWQRHLETRKTLQVFRHEFLTPIVAVWDDHDYGFDAAMGQHPLGEVVFEVFNVFFPQREIPGTFERGPGMSSSYRGLSQHLLLLDGRSFRETDSFNPIFGKDVEAWAAKQAQGGGVIWLGTGIQYFGGYLKKDSFEYDNPTAFSQFIKRLSQLPARFIFLSGDIHFSEVMEIEKEQLGYKTFEITSSSAHSATFPGRHLYYDMIGLTNPRRLGATSTHNFVLLKPSLTDNALLLETQGITWRGDVMFDLKLHMDLPEVSTTDCHQLVAP